MSKKTLVLFGGTGGLGSLLEPMLKEEYDVIALSSLTDVRYSTVTDDICFEYKPDIVINLSGYNFDSFLHKITKPHQREEVAELLDITIQGNLNILSSVLPGMRERGYGRIILASSVLAEKVQVGTGVYSAAKCFVDSLVRTASAENIGKGITCNSLRLGYFDGGICHEIPEKFSEPIRESIGLKRWGSIEELYNIVQFLIKTEYITGQNLNVSGGI